MQDRLKTSFKLGFSLRGLSFKTQSSASLCFSDFWF